MTSLESRLFALIEQQLDLPAGRVVASSRLDELGDSLDQIDLLLAIEDSFGVSTEGEQVPLLATVGDLLELLRSPVPA
jgi:acyl carrier protein